VFKAFGTEVPAEIQQVLNLSDINISKQFDPPFLLTESPGAVAIFLNSVAHLEKIDSSIRNVQGWIRGLEQDLVSGQKQIDQYTEELAGYEYLEKLEIDLEILEQQEKDRTQLKNSVQKLSTLISQYQSVEAEIEEISVWLRMEEEVDGILALYDTKASVLRDYNSLSVLLSNEKDLRQEIARKTRIVNLESLVDPILKLYQEKEEVERQMKELSVLINRVETLEAGIIANEKIKIPKLQKQFDQEIGPICPLCEQEIIHQH
jgi:hypothetical protein